MRKRIAEWYIRNKSKIAFVLFIALVLVIINIILVYAMRRNNNDDEQETTARETAQDIIANTYNTISVETAESTLTGEELTESQINSLDVIEQFVNYCNSNNLQEAYNLLSNECKEEMYNTLDDFTNNYYNNVFGGQKKNFSLENWTGNIYRVTITDDILSTGVYNEGQTLLDYMTIIRDDDGSIKLNINSYIGREEINKSRSNDYLDVTVLRSDTYMDYQTYTFRITNKTGNSILLDDKVSTDTMYLTDDNELNYSSYAHEKSEAELTFSPMETKEITIKYYNKYSSTREITGICFSRIVLNYGEYAPREYGTIYIEL